MDSSSTSEDEIPPPSSFKTVCGLDYDGWDGSDSSWYSSDCPSSDDSGGGVIVTQEDYDNDGGDVIVAHGVVPLSTEGNIGFQSGC